MSDTPQRSMRQFGTGATRDSDHDKLDYFGFLSPPALKLFAEYMHKHRKQADGTMRGSDNWKLGIPMDAYRRSLIRHVMEAWAKLEQGSLPVEELCAIFFNVQGLLHEAATDPMNMNRLPEHVRRTLYPEGATDGPADR